MNMFSFRRREKGMLWLSSQCNHVSPINSRSPLKDATGCLGKNLLSLAIKSVRSLAFEFPALSSNTQNSGMQTLPWTMPSINMLIWHRQNFQFVQSRARCHGLPASPMMWTIRRATQAPSRWTCWKKRSKRRWTDNVRARVSTYPESRHRLTVPVWIISVTSQTSVWRPVRHSGIWFANERDKALVSNFAYPETFFGKRISKYESLQGFILLRRVLWFFPEYFIFYWHKSA